MQASSLLLILTLWLVTHTLSAAELQVRLVDGKGKPIEGAVVWVDAKDSKPGAPTKVEISQVDRQFVPEVTIIQVGSTATFPNRDTVQHHVYSFSPAKKFDIPLYIGDAPEAIRFETPGIVTLGCNIHDKMAAYVLVLETKNHARSNADGLATLAATGTAPVPVLAWHPRLRGEPAAVSVTPGQAQVVELQVKPVFRRSPPGGGGGGSYK